MGLSWMPLLPHKVMQKADEELAKIEKADNEDNQSDVTESEREPLSNNKQNDTNSPSFSIDLNIVEESCHRYVNFCNNMESMSRKLFFVESMITLTIFMIGSLRCNPVLLRLIIGVKSIRNSQSSVKFAYQMATYFRAPLSVKNEWTHVPTLLYNLLCIINICLLTFDICYSVYLWIKVRKEVLFLHFKADKIATLQIRHILISMVVAPMVAFCQSRYTIYRRFYNDPRYFITNILSATLTGHKRLKDDFQASIDRKEHITIYKQKLQEREEEKERLSHKHGKPNSNSTSNSHNDSSNNQIVEETPNGDTITNNNNETQSSMNSNESKNNKTNNNNEDGNEIESKEREKMIDERKAFKEFEREYLNDATIFWDIELEKCKSTDMTDMEDVLELNVTSYCLLHLTCYMMFAGMSYLYIYCGIFTIVIILIFKFRFSKNIGIITPVLIPLLLVALEFVAFLFVAMLASLYMQPITAIVSISLSVLLIYSFFWKDNSAAAQLCGGVLDDVMQIGISGNNNNNNNNISNSLNRLSGNNTINMGNVKSE